MNEIHHTKAVFCLALTGSSSPSPLVLPPPQMALYALPVAIIKAYAWQLSLITNEKCYEQTCNL